MTNNIRGLVQPAGYVLESTPDPFLDKLEIHEGKHIMYIMVHISKPVLVAFYMDDRLYAC